MSSGQAFMDSGHDSDCSCSSDATMAYDDVDVCAGGGHVRKALTYVSYVAECSCRNRVTEPSEFGLEWICDHATVRVRASTLHVYLPHACTVATLTCGYLGVHPETMCVWEALDPVLRPIEMHQGQATVFEGHEVDRHACATPD